jgi:hypothetical protein
VFNIEQLVSCMIKKYYVKGMGKQISKDEYRDVIRILTIIHNEVIPIMGPQDLHKITNVAEAASYFNFSNPQFWALIESKVMAIIQ